MLTFYQKKNHPFIPFFLSFQSLSCELHRTIPTVRIKHVRKVRNPSKGSVGAISITHTLMITSVRLRPSSGRLCLQHNITLVHINMHAAKFDPTHFSSFHPSTLSIAVIAYKNTVFGQSAHSTTNSFWKRFDPKCDPARTSAERTSVFSWLCDPFRGGAAFCLSKLHQVFWSPSRPGNDNLCFFCRAFSLFLHESKHVPSSCSVVVLSDTHSWLSVWSRIGQVVMHPLQ